MKVKPWHELYLIDSLMIGKKAIVYTKMAYGKVEKHAYQITPDGRLEIHSTKEDSSKKMYNPKIRGIPISDTKGRLVFTWDETKPEYAYSLFDADAFEGRKNYDDLFEQIYNAGLNMGTLKARGGGRKSLLSDPIFLAVMFLIIVGLINVALVYLGFTAHGVEIFGAQKTMQ